MPDERKEQETAVVTVDGREWTRGPDGVWTHMDMRPETKSLLARHGAALDRVLALEAERAEIEEALGALGRDRRYRLFAQPERATDSNIASLLAWHRQRKTTTEAT